MVRRCLGKRVWIAMMAVGLVACGGRETPSNADAGPPDILPWPDVGIVRPDASGECVPGKPPTSDGVEREVVFVFKGAQTGWVASRGDYCAPFEIAKGKSVVRQEAPYTVECEGPAPPSPYVSGALPLASEPAVTWNGRQIAAYSACADCSVWQMGIISVTRYAQVSAQPGAYVATFGIYDDVPQQCNEDPTTHELWCSDNGSGWGGWGTGDPNGTCPLPTRLVNVPFTLPTAGSVTVEVDLSAP